MDFIGNTTFPFSQNRLLLNNVLISNKMVKNLISVRQFKTDNSVSVEFDPFGFSVKDFKTCKLLQHSNSVGDLYPVLPMSQSFLATALAAVSTHTWHRRLV